jgi:biotin carboxyl carrier protein
MPGVVSRVGVAAGDAVRETQPLLTLEAMKMETTVSATRTGVVSEVHVKAGDQVEAGDLLVELR